ncbi:MAG: WbqC family protein [Synergistaceae bacterium]|nr:WbqC family protein [Synergistaceae bacterium]
MRYEYPEYPQLYPPFEHGVSIVDTLFNIGRNVFEHLLPNGSST